MLCVAAVGATQVVDIDGLEASRFLEVSDDPQRKLVRIVPIAANDDSEALFVLLRPSSRLVAREWSAW